MDSSVPQLNPKKVDIEVGPRGSLELLSQREIDALTTGSRHAEIQELFRRCALAVLNTGNETDDAAAIFDAYSDFTVEVTRRTRGLQLNMRNAPSSALVDNRMIEGVRQHLFAVLRDVVYIGTELQEDLSSPGGITDAVFQILKGARVLEPGLPPRLVVCWGGHSINRLEYEYTKEVGYHLGLRSLDICTGCGPGAMKGPMKGAAVGHAKQRVAGARFIGLSEPGIIAAEPPNPMVNHLVVLPDIEKRLEAFVRLGHAIVVFPGGAGTVEEVLYLIGILLDEANGHIDLPVVFTGPPESAGYFQELDAFLVELFGENVREKYQVIVGNAAKVGESIASAVKRVRRNRRKTGDAYYFNWLLNVPEPHQQPFDVTHKTVEKLRLDPESTPLELAVAARQAFSAVVTGNVKDHGIRMVKDKGPFTLHADGRIAGALDRILRAFADDGRMKLHGEYVPCYKVVGQ